MASVKTREKESAARAAVILDTEIHFRANDDCKDEQENKQGHRHPNLQPWQGAPLMTGEHSTRIGESSQKLGTL